MQRWKTNHSALLFCNVKVVVHFHDVEFLNFQNTDGEFPVVLGRDCSGVVVAVGRDVSRVEQGEEVGLIL